MLIEIVIAASFNFQARDLILTGSDLFAQFRRIQLRTETEISGARFHRAEHVKNVLHVRKTTVISAPVLNCWTPTRPTSST